MSESPNHSTNKPLILVTGGTGFLGQHVVPLLREKFEVHVLSRSNKSEIRGDLCQWNAGLDLDKLKKKKFAIFLHMAGLYELTATHVDCFQHNITATGTALKVANALEIPVFMNTSSVAAGINSTLPSVKPSDLNFNRPFPDAYSESKALAEQLIQNWEADFRLRVNFRLGVLVGDTKLGKIQRIDGPYNAPLAFARLKTFIENFPTLLPLPGSEDRRLPIVPVDTAASAIVKFCEWSLDPAQQGYQSFHITPAEGLPVKNLYLATLKYLLIRNKGIRLVNNVPSMLVKQISKLALRFPQEELNYLLHFPQYESTETDRVLGSSWCPEFKDYEKAFWSGYEKYVSNR